MALHPDDTEGLIEPDENGNVNIAQLINAHYGVSLSEARKEIAIGGVQIEGESWEGDTFEIPADAIRGKRVAIKGEIRSFAFTYPER